MRILYVTTISLTMNSFFKPHIDMLVKEGYDVDIACNCRDLAIADFYVGLGCSIHQIDFSRSPLAKDNIRAYGQLKKVIQAGHYDIVHCHTPNASVITRLVCRKLRKKTGLKVFYTAHGFHFYKGAPKLNWMFFYPVERFCSRFTDMLITINTEDFELAKRRFKAKEIRYVPGVGVDLMRFEDVHIDRSAKRREIGVPEDALLITSVGELSPRKNHTVVLQALARVENPNIHYAIVGKGAQLSALQELAEANEIAHRIHFLGYRNDIPEIYAVSDICCLPSIHEGLPVALMEAMASGLPCIASRIRGSTDLISEESGFLVDTYDADGYAKAISGLSENEKLRLQMGSVNQERARTYSIGTIIEIMKSIYES